MEIQRNKEGREDQNLTWGDIQKMKYTWRVAQELMRIIPPVFGSFRKVVTDTSFGGFDIPKGWQVLQKFLTSFQPLNTLNFKNGLFFIRIILGVLVCIQYAHG